MQKYARSVLAVAAAIFFSACGAPPHDRALDIKPDAPTGNINSQAWTMVKATVSKSGTDALSVHLFGESVADCADFPPQESNLGYIIFNVPAKVGKRPLQLSFDFSDPDNQTITFVTPPSNNNIAVDGILNITALSDTSVTMGLLAKAGTGYDVNGTFTTAICP